MMKTIIIFGREARRAMKKKKNGEGGNDSDEDKPPYELWHRRPHGLANMRRPSDQG
jgi:hypothetical protein